MTKKENLNYGTCRERAAAKTRKPVYCYETDKVYESITATAEELDIPAVGIGKCCMGEYK